DLAVSRTTLAVVEGAIRALLNVETLDIDSDEALADAITNAYPGVMWVLTATGARSTAKANLVKALGERPIVPLLLYRASLATSIRMFMEPWVELARADGRLHPRWNQIRGERGQGARTGRMSV